MPCFFDIQGRPALSWSEMEEESMGGGDKGNCDRGYRGRDWKGEEEGETGQGCK